MERAEIVGIVREAQGIIDEVFGLSGDSIVKAGLMLWTVQELAPKMRVHIPPYLAKATPAPPEKCPHLCDLKLQRKRWIAKCSLTKDFCDIETGLRDYRGCLHYKAGEVIRWAQGRVPPPASPLDII